MEFWDLFMVVSLAFQEVIIYLCFVFMYVCLFAACLHAFLLWVNLHVRQSTVIENCLSYNIVMN